MPDAQQAAQRKKDILNGIQWSAKGTAYDLAQPFFLGLACDADRASAHASS